MSHEKRCCTEKVIFRGLFMYVQKLSATCYFGYKNVCVVTCLLMAPSGENYDEKADSCSVIGMLKKYKILPYRKVSDGKQK